MKPFPFTFTPDPTRPGVTLLWIRPDLPPLPFLEAEEPTTEGEPHPERTLKGDDL